MELYGKNSTSTCNLEELGGVFSKPLCEMINIIYYFLQHYYLQHYHSIGYYFLNNIFCTCAYTSDLILLNIVSSILFTLLSDGTIVQNHCNLNYLEPTKISLCHFNLDKYKVIHYVTTEIFNPYCAHG